MQAIVSILVANPFNSDAPKELSQDGLLNLENENLNVGKKIYILFPYDFIDCHD